MEIEHQDSIAEDQKSIEKIMDQLFCDLGGFGRYQIFMCFNFFCQNTGVYALLVSLSYLEKIPHEYFCTYADNPDVEITC